MYVSHTSLYFSTKHVPYSLYIHQYIFIHLCYCIYLYLIIVCIYLSMCMCANTLSLPQLIYLAHSVQIHSVSNSIRICGLSASPITLTVYVVSSKLPFALSSYTIGHTLVKVFISILSVVSSI